MCCLHIVLKDFLLLVCARAFVCLCVRAAITWFDVVPFSHLLTLSFSNWIRLKEKRRKNRHKYIHTHTHMPREQQEGGNVRSIWSESVKLIPHTNTNTQRIHGRARTHTQSTQAQTERQKMFTLVVNCKPVNWEREPKVFVWLKITKMKRWRWQQENTNPVCRLHAGELTNCNWN